MTVAIDTNVLVRLLVRDDEAQFVAARQLVDAAAAADEPVLVLLCALRETEWVLRSRCKVDKASIAAAFTQLLESSDVEFEHVATRDQRTQDRGRLSIPRCATMYIMLNHKSARRPARPAAPPWAAWSFAVSGHHDHRVCAPAASRHRPAVPSP